MAGRLYWPAGTKNPTVLSKRGGSTPANIKRPTHLERPKRQKSTGPFRIEKVGEVGDDEVGAVGA